MKRISGVYQIINKITGDKYIGSSVDIDRRKRYHRSALKKGDHTNIHLQRAYNKYGSKYFKFSILIYCDPEMTLVYEQMLLDAGIGNYNIAIDAVAPMKGKYGEETSFYGRRHTKESRRKISKNHADFSGSKHPLYGRGHSEKSRRKISKNHADFSGKNHPQYGKRGKDSHMWGFKHTEESKRKVSEAKKRYWQSKKDRSITEEQKEKISHGLKEYYKTHDPVPRTKEYRDKISEGLKRYYREKKKVAN